MLPRLPPMEAALTVASSACGFSMVKLTVPDAAPLADVLTADKESAVAGQ